MLSLFLLCWLCSHVHGQDLGEELSQTLLSLIAEERNIRAQLEEEADLLEKQLDTLTSLRQNATCGCPTASNHVIAFSATLINDIATLGKQQIVVYDNVTLNIGNGYDIRHGIFTAPITGVYEFTTAVLTKNGRTTGLEMVKNGQSKTKVQSGDSNYLTMGTNAVALQLNIGDEVWVRHMNQSDSNTIMGQSTTSFSGYLIDV